ncbi:chalcone-flavanone isomerase-domain-containing protein [Pilobolus umbonatus]|nr:chalcone-flavanone isomerase-domain-containing protein [Pilobolus umbonatus]
MLRFIRPVQRVLITHPIRQQKSRVLPTLVAGVGLTATYLAYQSQYPVYLDSPSTVTDPASNVSFPVYLSTDHKRLIGLGVRTVSFLKMHVYIIGMYMRSEDLGELKKVKGWEHFDKQEFLENRELADRLLDQPYDISIRIVSARNTNTQHLRDGFVRLLLQRMKDQKMTEEEERDVLKGIQEFKSNFPSMRVEKHTVFVFTKTSNGELDMAYEGKHLGTVPNKWISKNFVMSYLEPKAPSSEAALHDIANGFETLLK